MRWEYAAESAQHEVYRLIHDDKVLLTLTINPRSQSARVECNKDQRVFLVRREGFLKSKIVLRNEYGIRIGEIRNGGPDAFIEVDGRRFRFTLRNNPLAELALYAEDRKEPLITCGLKIEGGSTAVQVDRNTPLHHLSHPSLLMALCWYLFLPIARENVPEYALQQL